MMIVEMLKCWNSVMMIEHLCAQIIQCLGDKNVIYKNILWMFFGFVLKMHPVIVVL